MGDRQTDPHGSRSFSAFLRAVRETRVFWLRTAAVATLGTSLLVTKGVLTTITALVIGVLIGVLVGYPLFKKRGRVPRAGVRRGTCNKFTSEGQL